MVILKLPVGFLAHVGPRFRQRVQRIDGSFTSIQSDLDKEKRVILKQWAKRDKQIQRVMRTTVGMYGDLQGIAGKTIQESESLDLDDSEPTAIKANFVKAYDMNNLRIVCLSDTHGLHRNVTVPDGDVLVHAGDFSGADHSLEAVREFDRWLAELPHPCKIVIPGNHEFALEEHPAPHSLFRNATLLINEEIGTLGLRIWGSPATPLYGGAFGRSSRLDRRKLYSAIPDGIDILVTHGPPYGLLDFEATGGHAGCSELLAAVAEIKPKLHIFGHIHGSYGLRLSQQTTFVNASLCGSSGHLENEPIIFELENPNQSRQKK